MRISGSDTKMNIVILGPQGSGKGTQAEMLVRKFQWEHVDMGKALRGIAKQDTQLGKEIYAIQNVTHTLVPNIILQKALRLKLGSIPREQGLILDGLPRTIDQIECVVSVVQEYGRKINKVFFVNISPEESVRRVSRRWSCGACGEPLIMGRDIENSADPCPKCGGNITQRVDDTEEGIKKRLEVFARETLPVVRDFQKQGLAAEINGEQPKEKVFQDILSHLKDPYDT